MQLCWPRFNEFAPFITLTLQIGNNLVLYFKIASNLMGCFTK
jgi:hypothetical protein